MSGRIKPPFGRYAPDAYVRSTQDEGQVLTRRVMHIGKTTLYPSSEFGLFTSDANSGRVEDHVQANLILLAGRELGLYKQFSPQMLRETAATFLKVADILDANAARLAAEALTRAGKGGA